VPTGQTHGDLGTDRKYWFNDHTEDVKSARLHAWNDGSEDYSKGPQGNCKNIGAKCDERSEVCHQLSADMLKSVHQKAKLLFPNKYRNL
jgi:hypothetical protein